MSQPRRHVPIPYGSPSRYPYSAVRTMGPTLGTLFLDRNYPIRGLRSIVQERLPEEGNRAIQRSEYRREEPPKGAIRKSHPQGAIYDLSSTTSKERQAVLEKGTRMTQETTTKRLRSAT